MGIPIKPKVPGIQIDSTLQRVDSSEFSNKSRPEQDAITAYLLSIAQQGQGGIETDTRLNLNSNGANYRKLFAILNGIHAFNPKLAQSLIEQYQLINSTEIVHLLTNLREQGHLEYFALQIPLVETIRQIWTPSSFLFYCSPLDSRSESFGAAFVPFSNPTAEKAGLKIDSLRGIQANTTMAELISNTLCTPAAHTRSFYVIKCAE
jgi:hypothetical protein